MTSAGAAVGLVLSHLRSQDRPLTKALLQEYTGLPKGRVRAAPKALDEAGCVRPVVGREVSEGCIIRQAIWWGASR